MFSSQSKVLIPKVFSAVDHSMDNKLWKEINLINQICFVVKRMIKLDFEVLVFCSRCPRYFQKTDVHPIISQVKKT